jgi:dipeptidyl aminopeptidase/acylaminoacyl peptidase
MTTRVLCLLGVFIAATCASAERLLTPPAALTVDGIAPIPAELVDTVGRYTAVRSAQLADWHPADHQLLVATRFGDTAQIHRVRRPGGAREQLTFYPDAVGNASYHPNGGEYFLFSKDTGGGEWYQLYRYDLATRQVTRLTDGKSRNILGPWSKDGNRIAYVSTRRTGEDTDLWVMNPADPGSDRLLAPLKGGGWTPLAWSPDGGRILLLEGISINESYLWLVDTHSGERTALTPRRAGRMVSYSGGEFAADGGRIYTASDEDSEYRRLVSIDLATGSRTLLTASLGGDVEEFDLTRSGRRLAYVVNAEGASALHVLDTAKHRELPRPTLPTGIIGALLWHRDGHTLGFSLASAREPGDVYSLDVATRKLERWTASESAVPTGEFPNAELVHWTSFDGRSISGFLYRPPARFTGPRPVLIDIHGGPEGQARPGFLGRNNYLLNELGIALIFPNVRGSTGFGKSFALADNGRRRADTYKDIAALMDWIGTRADLDAKRIGVTGGSYGGHMTLAMATFYSDRIRCAVDVVGMSNLVTFLEHTEGYRRDLRRAEYGDERDPEMRAYLESIAPMNHLGDLRKPLLVVAGANDPRVPLSESEQIVRALKAQGTEVAYIAASDEGHGFRKKPNRDYEFYATVRFLEQHLLN